jgi:nitronate monooxygenase
MAQTVRNSKLDTRSARAKLPMRDSPYYPVQCELTAAMREAGQRTNDIHRIQAWAGQSAALARAERAGDIVARLWAEADLLLPG